MSDANDLLPQHQKLLDESGISNAVAMERGYRSVTTRAELKRLGFADSQCRVPCLLLPVYGVGGEIVLYQSRPDTPRIRDGKALKYETPAKSRMAIDVPPLARAMLGKPDVPLIVTEGVRKADSAATHGLCCIDVLGVWNWRGSNAYGGKLVLPDFESIALNGRDVYLCFDSDVITKPAVRQALERLSEFLQSRGATVRILLLPMGDGGVKVGLDDYFAAGHTAADLFALVVERLPPSATEAAQGASTGPYRVVDGGIAWVRPAGDDESIVRLCNFTAEIVQEVVADDGQTEQGELAIRGTLDTGEKLPTIRVPTHRYEGLHWISAQWGVRAIVSAGQGSRDRLREAIQRLSPSIEHRREYTHPGWRQIDDTWCFLSQDAVIGPNGPVDGIVVRLAKPAHHLRLRLPSATEQGEAAASFLGLLELAPDRIMVPLLGGVLRALLNTVGQADVVLFLVGPSGVLKSELAAVIQRCFGPGFDRLNLPAAWSSTPNALERIAFDFKDCLLVVDDFAPSGSIQDVRRYHQTAERVIRGAGNAAGRERMHADGTIRPSLPPRGLILGTGEDIPSGYSIRARSLVLEVGKSDVVTSVLTRYQEMPHRILPSLLLAAYLRWLAGHMDQIAKDYQPSVARLRSAMAEAGAHARTPDTLAGIGLAWKLWLRFAIESGHLSQEEGNALWSRVETALRAIAQSQAQHLAQENPVQRFLDLLRGCLASGAAHVAGPDGTEPGHPEAWGWRLQTVGSGEYAREEWRPQGRGVGWLDADGLYLEPQAGYGAVQQFGAISGTGLAIAAPTLWKRMAESGLLASTDMANRQTRLVRRSFSGSRRQVIHLAPDVLEAADVPEESTSSGDDDLAPGRVFEPDPEPPERQPDQPMQVEFPDSSEFSPPGRVGRVKTGEGTTFVAKCVYCFVPLEPGDQYACATCRVAVRKSVA